MRESSLTSALMQPGLKFGTHVHEFIILKPEPMNPFVFRPRDKSKEVQKAPFQSLAPASETFDQLRDRSNTVAKVELQKNGHLSKLLETEIPIYGSKRLKNKHDRSSSVLNQGKRILLSKLPPDVTADFLKISGERQHFKASASMIGGREPTLSFRDEDVMLKK